MLNPFQWDSAPLLGIPIKQALDAACRQAKIPKRKVNICQRPCNLKLLLQPVNNLQELGILEASPDTTPTLPIMTMAGALWPAPLALDTGQNRGEGAACPTPAALGPHS